ncbi:MAG: chromate transporter, partial [Alphaproteobacteria bacterium]
MRLETLVTIALVFIPFSLTSIGGGGAIVAGIQHETVVVHAWLNSRDFLDVFAVSRAAPGPGMMLATVIGWKVAGWLGALVATLALFIPSSLLCYCVFK